MEYSQKVTISKNVKNINMILICIMGSISLLGLVMGIYSLVLAKIIYALIYFVAVVLGFSYVVMRINTIMPTFIAKEGEHLYVQNWDNGLFPFNCDNGIIGEFIPARILLKKIDICGISKIYLGTRNYLLKLLPDGEFIEKIKNPEQKYEKILKRMEFLYILTRDKHEIYMAVTDFDDEELAKLLKPVVEENEKIDFKCNNRVVSKYIPPKRITL